MRPVRRAEVAAREFLMYAFADAPFHLRRGGARERHDEQVINVPFVVKHVLHDALDEHGRFA